MAKNKSGLWSVLLLVAAGAMVMLGKKSSGSLEVKPIANGLSFTMKVKDASLGGEITYPDVPFVRENVVGPYLFQIVGNGVAIGWRVSKGTEIIFEKITGVDGK